jgi:hypothetical protein
MRSIRVSLTLLFALTLSLAFALPATAQPPCAVCGDSNTRVGSNALVVNTGSGNTAIGSGALNHNTTGSSNNAIGLNAGFFLTTGSNNIHIGNVGNEADDNLIRIGAVGFQTRTFIAGIFGADVLGKALPVEVNSLGQLGTTISSRRVKDDIRDMAEASAGLSKLRPVTFHYKAEQVSGPRPIEYGLIAEEVAEIYPELVVLDKDGQPTGVRYHVLPVMLLNELQRQQRVIEGQASRLTEYDERFHDQTRLIDELTARLSRLEAKGAAAVR